MKKIKVSYNIDKETASLFVKVSKIKAINMSKLIENMIVEWVKKNQ